MSLYTFSPIKDETELLKAIEFIHFACHKLCTQSFGKYLSNAGNIGVFCHYNEEYRDLITIREKLCESSNDPNQKYFELHKPIIIKAKGGAPETTYTHLYIRKPDPYRHQVGDIDFYLSQGDYNNLKQSLENGKEIKGARIFPRNDLDMIELFDPDVDALGYVSTNQMSQKVHIKLSNETNL